jgi:hypothetical protein
MALYKDTANVKLGHGSAFETTHRPGERVPHSGIYRCENCGDEIASNHGDPFPPQNHHQHKPGAGEIRWRMLVYAQQQG